MEERPSIINMASARWRKSTSQQEEGFELVLQMLVVLKG
jgi:hypothetical protein